VQLVSLMIHPSPGASQDKIRSGANDEPQSVLSGGPRKFIALTLFIELTLAQS
jgi:hypothetical protein